MSGVTIQAECLLPGTAAGQVALLSAPLSLWGGFDLESGRICDANHPQHGMTIAGRILVMPGGRGSSSSSSILLESARLGIHPRAIVITDRDPILVVGALVAFELYGVNIPIIRAGADAFEAFPSTATIKLSADAGSVCILQE